MGIKLDITRELAELFELEKKAHRSMRKTANIDTIDKFVDSQILPLVHEAFEKTRTLAHSGMFKTPKGKEEITNAIKYLNLLMRALDYAVLDEREGLASLDSERIEKQQPGVRQARRSRK